MLLTKWILADCVVAAIMSLSAGPVTSAPAQYFRSDGGIAGQGGGRSPSDFDLPGVLRWRVPVDPGHSTPVVCGGKLILTTYRAGKKELTTVALDAQTGKVLWKQTAPTGRLEQFHQATGSPATATPACDGEHVFVFFGSYGLICYGLDGQKLWDHPMGPFRDEYGAGSSPVLADGKIILQEDHDIGSFLMALDARTGKELWKTPRPDAVRSYSTPAVWTHDGRTQLLVAGALELTGYDPANGEKLWWVSGLARIVIPVPVPVGTGFTWPPGRRAGIPASASLSIPGQRLWRNGTKTTMAN